MWALVQAGNVIRVFTRPTAFSIGDINHPANVFSVWSEAELNAISIYLIVEDRTNVKDEKYYINTNVTHTYNAGTGKVDATWGSPTAKGLDDVNWTQEQVDNGHSNGGTTSDVATEGLKTIKKRNIDKECDYLLQDSDWMAVKAFEENGDVESGWKTWRASIRTKCNSMQAQIDGAADVDALAALYAYVNTGTVENPVIERPLGEFPVKE